MSDNPHRVSVWDFHTACRKNEMGPIRRYVSDQGDDIHATADFGWTGLHWAAYSGHVEVCRFLVENGADTAKRSRGGETALDLARKFGRGAVVALLEAPPQPQAMAPAAASGGGAAAEEEAAREEAARVAAEEEAARVAAEEEAARVAAEEEAARVAAEEEAAREEAARAAAEEEAAREEAARVAAEEEAARVAAEEEAAREEAARAAAEEEAAREEAARVAAEEEAARVAAEEEAAREEAARVAAEEEAARAAIPEHMTPDLPAGRADVDFAGAGLGSGSFADVRSGTYRFPGQADPMAVAFKIFRGGQALSAAMRRQMVQELRVGQQLRHPNLIRLFGIVELPERGPALLMELATGGSLRDLLSDQDRHPELPWQRRLSWLRDVANGMVELHGLLPRRIIHRDLKAANVLLSSPDLASATAKVADFGVAIVMETVRATLSGGGGGMAGTLSWKAPETFADRYSEQSDVFAFAVVCFEVATRQIPWDGVGQPAIIERLRSRFEYNEMMFTNFGVSREQQLALWEQQNPLATRRPDLALVEAGCPEALLVFVERCWADDPNQRPRFTECVQELTAIKPASTFGNSNFKAAHDGDAEPVTFATDVFYAVNNFLRQYCRAYGLTSVADNALLQHFILALQRQTGQHVEVDPLALAGPTAELLWTSNLRFEGVAEQHSKELCSLINAAIRDDRPDLAAPVARVARSVNTLCIVRGLDVAALAGLRFPPGGRTFRGTGFDNQYKDFFTVGKSYRVPGFLATSFSEDVATRFMLTAEAYGRQPVMWVVHVDPAGEHDADRRCKHVNYVSHTHVGGEAEFLFAPYSIFTVLSVEWGENGAPHRIELYAATDNRAQAEGGEGPWATPVGSEELPNAPWY